MKNLANVNDSIESINKGTFGIVMVAMTGQRGVRKTNKPYICCVKKITKTTTAIINI